MRRPIVLIAVGAALVASTAIAQTPERVLVKVGASQQLAVYSYVPRDCRAEGRTRIKVVNRPVLGALTVRDDVPFTITRSNYPACVGVASVGAGLFYSARETGRDTMRVRIVYPDKHREIVDFTTIAD